MLADASPYLTGVSKELQPGSSKVYYSMLGSIDVLNNCMFIMFNCTQS
jgi:hypothetical protein